MASHRNDKSMLRRAYLWGREFIFDFRKLVAFVPKGTQRIVDIGCGYGILESHLAKAFPHARIRAYDLNKSRIAYLQRSNTHANLQFFARDATASPTDAQVIIAVDLLHHIPYAAQRRLLENIHTHSPADVTLLIKDMDKGRFSFRQLCNLFIDLVSARQWPLFYHDLASFEQLFHEQGFAIKKQVRLNKWYVPLNHVLFVLKKKTR